MLHSRNAAPVIIDLVGASPNVMWPKSPPSVSAVQTSLFQKFEAGLCAVWRVGFLLATRPFFFTSSYCASSNSHTASFCIPADVIGGFFFASSTIFLAVVAEVFARLPDCGLFSAETLIYLCFNTTERHHQVLGYPFVSLSCFRQFSYLFQIPSSAFTMTQSPETSVAG